MIEARYTIGNKPRGSGEIEYKEVYHQFLTIDMLEDFLAYNRSYITRLEFTGALSYPMNGDNE